MRWSNPHERAGGEAESLLGAALKPHRDPVVIATKVGFRAQALGGSELQKQG